MFASDHWHRELNLETLGHRLRSMPMLLLVLPYIVGIVLAERYALPLYGSLTAMVAMVVLAVLFLNRGISRLYVAAALVLMGYVVVELRTSEAYAPYDCQCDMVVSVESRPAERDGYRVADGRIEAWHNDEGWHRADDRVRLWIRSDSVVHGARLLVNSSLKSRISRWSDYDELMRRRGYVGGVSIADYNLLAMENIAPTDLHSIAQCRLERYRTDSVAFATVEAMVVGSRSGIPAELSEAYSRTGLSHLLAVSGLHLGIVLMVVSLLLSPLRLIHRGHRMIALMVIVAVWVFVAVSGASPSVVRAAIMLSVLQLSRITASNYSSVNALATTIFAMLVYRPDYLFDISFQLSVAAVFGIVVWGMPLMSRLHGVGGLWRGVLSTVIIGVVATLWTLPIVSYNFGTLPIVGVVVTPCVLLFAYIIVGGGVVALVLPAIVAAPFVALAEWGAAIQNDVVLWAAELPFACVDYAISAQGLLLCYLLYVSVTVVMWSINRKKVITLPQL